MLWMELDSVLELLMIKTLFFQGKKKRAGRWGGQEREYQSSVGAHISKLKIYFDLQRLLIQIFGWQPVNRF